MLPALNDATVLAGMCKGSFVRGLIPSLAGRTLEVNVPKPTKVTLPSFLRPSVIASIVASSPRAASALENPVLSFNFTSHYLLVS